MSDTDKAGELATQLLEHGMDITLRHPPEAIERAINDVRKIWRVQRAAGSRKAERALKIVLDTLEDLRGPSS